MELNIQTVLEAMGRPRDFVQTIPDARVAVVEGKGSGLFATRARLADELVCKLDGQVVDCELYPEVMIALEWNALSERLLLVRPLRTSYGYINHARTPNLAIDPDGVHLRAARHIAACEEFTLNYLAPPVPPAYLASAEGRFLCGVD